MNQRPTLPFHITFCSSSFVRMIVCKRFIIFFISLRYKVNLLVRCNQLCQRFSKECYVCVRKNDQVLFRKTRVIVIGIFSTTKLVTMWGFFVESVFGVFWICFVLCFCFVCLFVGFYLLLLLLCFILDFFFLSETVRIRSLLKLLLIRWLT